MTTDPFHPFTPADGWTVPATAWIDQEAHRPYIGRATRDRYAYGSIVELKSGQLSKVLMWLDDYSDVNNAPGMPRTTVISEDLDLCLTDDDLAYMRILGEASSTFGPIKAEEYRDALMWIECPCCGRKMKTVNYLRRVES